MKTHEYALDVKLNCAIRVKAGSEEAAVAILKAKLDAASANLGAFDDGQPILCEVSLDGAAPKCFEVDGEELPAKKKTRFVVESCDEDENQIFCDIVLAEHEDKATEMIEAIRGDYAVVCNTFTLDQHIENIKQNLSHFQDMAASTDEKIVAEFTEFLESNCKCQCKACGKITDEDDISDDDLCEDCQGK